MADTAKRLAGPALVTSGESTHYTVPGSTTAIIRSIHIVNTTTSTATVSLSIGADAAGTRLLSATPIPPNATYDWSGFLVMAAAETLRAQSGTNNALAITVSGVEVA